MGAYVRCGRNKVYHRNLFVAMAFFFVQTEMNRKEKHYTLINVPVHGEQTEPNAIFVAFFSHKFDRLCKFL